MTTTIDHWADRVDGGDWDRVTEELNEYGGALLPRLLTLFPLQVVINLNDPGVDHTGGEFLLLEQRPPGPSRAGPRPSYPTVTAWSSPPGTGPWRPSADGPPPPSATACRRSAPATGTAWR